MPHPTEGAAERPDPLSDQHVAFPGAPAPRPTGPRLPDSAWAPAARTAPAGASPPSPPPTGSSTPAPPTPNNSLTGHGAPTPSRRRRVLGAIVVIWICFGVFGNHDYHSGDMSSGTGMESSSGGYGPDMPADGHNPAALLPVSTGVDVVPNGVKQFRVEVASADGSTTVTVKRNTKQGNFESQVAGAWSGTVVPTAGYAAPVAPTDLQSSNGPVGPTVSGIVTATATDSTSTVQCRVYADDVLVLMSTGPGTVTCRIPAVDGAGG